MNVGYPGKFYAPVYHTSFRKEVILPTETPIEWTSTGKVKVSVNGKETGNSDKSSLTLPKGKSILLFKSSKYLKMICLPLRYPSMVKSPNG